MEENKMNEPNLAEELAKAKLAAETAEREKAEALIAKNQAEAALINFRPAPKVVELDKAEVYAEKILNAKGGMTNREYLETMSNYRKAHLKETGEDVFADRGKPDTEAQAKYVAESIDQLLEENQDSAEFNFRLNQALRDDPTISKMLKARA